MVKIQFDFNIIKPDFLEQNRFQQACNVNICQINQYISKVLTQNNMLY